MRLYQAAGLAATAVMAGAVLVERGDANLHAQGPITFSEHVAPIVFANCTPCHRPGEAAPFQLLGYEDARPLARRMAAVTASQAMPPWKANPGDYEFANARRLSEGQIATIQRWVADGMLEGDRGKLPPMPLFTDGWQLGPPGLAVSMSEPFEVPARGPDIYRSFVVPLGLDEDRWVRAVEFRPSARSVVHHSLFFLDTTGAARQRDARDPLPGFSGGMGGARLGAGSGSAAGLAALLGGGGSADPRDDQAARVGGLGGWAVGGRALELPRGMAFFVPKGSDLILATHFHSSGKVERETSTIGLHFADAPPTEAFTTIQLPPVFGVFEGIDIPAGQPRYTIADTFELPVDVRAFSIGAHAHYLGREMKLTATLPDGALRILLWIPDWDFSWQEQYRFKDFVNLPKGTRLHAEINYDNSEANKRNPSRPPVRVTWGEESTDEMGSLSLQVVAANAADLPRLRQALREHVRNAAFSRPGLKQLLQQRIGLRRNGQPR